MVVSCFTLKNELKVSKTLHKNCWPLPVSRKPAIRYSMTQWSKKIEETCGAVDFGDGTARVNLIYQSIIATMNCVPVVVFGNTRKISSATSARGPCKETVSGGASSKASSVCSAFTAAADCLKNVVGHVQPVQLTSHSVVHATLAGMYDQFWITGQVKEAWSEPV